MDNIINFFSNLGDLLVGIVENLINFYGLVGESFGSIVGLFHHMPSYLLYPLVALASIAIAKLLIPGGGSSV